MNIASIDIGSNTILLLIAKVEDHKIIPIYNQYETPRLGKDLKIGGKILDNKIEELLKILLDFKRKIIQYKCSKTIITATNAMRIASNSDEIINIVKSRLDLEIKIISGSEEARLSFLGASSAFPEINEKVVIDIGGGSTEIIYGNKNKIIYKHSFQVGTVSLTGKFLSSFPHDPKITDKINSYLKDVFEELKSNIANSLPTIAVAGTPTTLYCMSQNLKEYYEQKVEKSQLKYNELNNLSEKLLVLSPDEIKQKYGPVVYGREDVILAGSLILKYLSELALIDRIHISGRGLRYGNIMDCIDNLN